MKNFKKSPIFFALFASLVFSSAFAQESATERCREYTWKPGDIIQVPAQRFKQTHVTLPEETLDVLWAAKELWDIQSVKNHIFFIPSSDQPEGAESTVTAVGTSGAAYEFKAVRANKLASHCIVLKNASLINRASWESNSKDSGLQDQVERLQQQVAKATAERAQAVVESKRQAQMAVKSYRSTIFSNYDWTEPSGWFASSGIESVQDDGRFTYIRLKSDSKGILAISAEIDGQTEVIEKIYDAAKREYRIAGVYPKFKLRAGESEITIKRRGT